MGPEILSLIGGFPFLPGPLERSSTVHKKQFFFVSHMSYRANLYVVLVRSYALILCCI